MVAGYSERRRPGATGCRAVAGEPIGSSRSCTGSGRATLNRSELSWLSGYDRSLTRPRGNGSGGPIPTRRLRGEVISALHEGADWALRLGARVGPRGRHQWTSSNRGWKQPETVLGGSGPRGTSRTSKVMAWVAVDRAIRDVEEFALEVRSTGGSAMRTRFTIRSARGVTTPDRETLPVLRSHWLDPVSS